MVRPGGAEARIRLAARHLRAGGVRRVVYGPDLQHARQEATLARRVFFSFHYERDIWRANVVRNSWVTQDREAAGFFDASLWEEAKRKGDEAIKRMIDAALVGTSVTAVLIGKETANRTYVKYEIDKSIDRGNGLLGVRINQIGDRSGITDDPGPNPLPSRYKLYYWFSDDGYKNFGAWVEEAAKAAGK